MEKEYSEKLLLFSKIIKLSMKVSRLAGGRIAESDKITWACILNTKICVTGTSLFILTPESDITTKKIAHWDFSTMFTLARNIMECYQTMFYLCIDNVTEEELFARKKLFNLHDYYSRKKLFSFTTEKEEDIEIEKTVIQELSETAYFKNLEEKQQKHFLKGENSFFVNREDIEEKMGNDKNEFKFLYKLFSSNTHSFPMGFFGMLDGTRGTGMKSEVEIHYSGLALDVAGGYIKESTKNILSFFGDINDLLTKEEKQQLE